MTAIWGVLLALACYSLGRRVGRAENEADTWLLRKVLTMIATEADEAFQDRVEQWLNREASGQHKKEGNHG